MTNTFFPTKIYPFNLKNAMARLALPWLIIEPEKLDMHISELGLSNTTYNALMRSGIQTVRDALAHKPNNYEIVANFRESKKRELEVKLYAFLV